jgi:hypothetical protein
MPPLPPLAWKKLTESVEVLKVWELKKGQYPEIAIMNVSHDQYLKFSRDPKGFMDFVNAQKVFSKAVIVSGSWVTLSAIDQKAHHTRWILTLDHGKESWMIVSALPALEDEHLGKK